MPIWLLQLLIPVAVDTIKSYVSNSDSKKDDKVLEVVQLGAKYLAPKANNTVSQNLVKKLNTDSMRKTQE